MLVFCRRRFEMLADSRYFTTKMVKLAGVPFV
jgi:hypothetical protein